RAVVARVQAGRGMGSSVNFLRRGDWPDDRFQFCPRNSSRTKQDRLGLGQREHGGLDADLTGSAVEYEIYVAAQAAANVVGGGRRKFAEAVRAGCGERNASGADQG